LPDLLRALYTQLLEPVAEHLPAEHSSRLAIVPDSSLATVPFSALMDAGGRLLIEHGAVVTAPSLSLLIAPGLRTLMVPLGDHGLKGVMATRFYQGIEQGESKLDALREAQLEALRSGAPLQQIAGILAAGPL